MVVSDGCSKFLFFDLDVSTAKKTSQNSFFINFYRVPALFGSIFATGKRFEQKWLNPMAFPLQSLASPAPTFVLPRIHESGHAASRLFFLQKKNPFLQLAVRMWMKPFWNARDVVIHKIDLLPRGLDQMGLPKFLGDSFMMEMICCV